MADKNAKQPTKTTKNRRYSKRATKNKGSCTDSDGSDSSELAKKTKKEQAAKSKRKFPWKRNRGKRDLELKERENQRTKEDKKYPEDESDGLYKIDKIDSRICCEGTMFLECATLKPATVDTGLQYDDGPVSFERRDGEDRKIPQRILKPEEKVQPEYEVTSGLFSDGFRRADYVLALDGSFSADVESVRLSFLSGLVKTGFQIEAETATLDRHKSLQFVKVHAPDPLLVWYPSSLGVQRHFRDAHEQFVSSSWQHEREWLRHVRAQYIPPLHFSNLERSYLVHMILRCHTFGDPANYYGLQRLLDSKVILDAYPLHDGPYFNVYQRNFTKFNTRQVLFLNWAGMRNILRPQPLHLIHEYFGSKLAFYFMFYEAYLRALVVAAAWGVFMTILFLIKDTEYLSYVRNKLCSDNRPSSADKIARAVCPACVTGKLDHCPYSMSVDHCADMHVLQFVDSPYLILYSFGISFWALLFLVYWRRTQCYYNWLWEECHSAERQIIRLGHKPPPNTQLSVGGTNNTFSHRAANAALGIFIPLIVLTLLVAVTIWVYVTMYTTVLAPAATTLLNNTVAPSYTVVPDVDQKKHMGLLMLTGLAVQVGLFVFEKICHFVSYAVTKFENHRTLQQFEESLIKKYFSYGFVITSASTIYFVWLKGLFFTTPAQLVQGVFGIWTPWQNYTYNMTKDANSIKNLTVKILTSNCSPFSCFREGVIIFFCTLFIRLIGVKALDMIYNIVKQILWSNKHVLEIKNKPPSTCEREYDLKTVTEKTLMQDYNALFLQVALVMLFTPLCPLAPLFLLLINLIDLRLKAHQYVVSSRRVMFFNAPGIGHWNTILAIICFSVPLFHALTLVKTEVFKMYIFHKYHPKETAEEKFYKYIIEANYNRTFAIEKKRMWVLNLIENKYSSPPEYARVHTCRVDGFYNTVEPEEFARAWPLRWNLMENNHTGAAPLAAHYHIKYLKVMFILVYVNVFALVSLLVWYYSRGCPGLSARAQLRERTLRRLHHHTLHFKRGAHTDFTVAYGLSRVYTKTGAKFFAELKVPAVELEWCAAARTWRSAVETLGVTDPADTWRQLVDSSPADSLWHSLRNCVAYQAGVWQKLQAKEMAEVTYPAAFKMAIVLRHTPQDLVLKLLAELLKEQEDSPTLTAYILALLTDDEPAPACMCSEVGNPTPLRDLQLFGDCELAVLAASREEYDAHAKLVRAEYSKLTHDHYVELRVKVLDQFSQIPKIFHTPEFEFLEPLARENIERELCTLRDHLTNGRKETKQEEEEEET